MASQFVLILVGAVLCINLYTTSGKLLPQFLYKAVDCSGTAEWNHTSPTGLVSHATVQCKDKSVLITVNSPSTATRVSLQVLDQDAVPLQEFSSPSDTGASLQCSKRLFAEGYLANLPVVAEGTGVTAETQLGHAAVEWNEWDDYYDQAGLRSISSAKATKNAPRDETMVSSLEYGHDECGAMLYGPDDDRYIQGFNSVLVKEFLYVDGVVELVSRVILIVYCDVSANQPGPGTVQPDVKNEEAEVCDQTSYSLSGSVVGEEYRTDVANLVHPTTGDIGYYIDSLDYSGNSIISSGGDLSPLETAINIRLSPPKCTSLAYLVLTDVVVVPGGRGVDKVDVNANLRYCSGGNVAVC